MTLSNANLDFEKIRMKFKVSGVICSTNIICHYAVFG